MPCREYRIDERRYEQQQDEDPVVGRNVKVERRRLEERIRTDALI